MDAALDFICDVRNDLHGFTEVFASAFFVNDRLVDPAGGDVVRLCGLDVQEPLVVPKVQVRFCAINGHVALPVFVGVQGAGIDIDVRVELLNGHRMAARLKQLSQRCADNPFSEARAYATRDENVAAVAHRFRQR